MKIHHSPFHNGRPASHRLGQRMLRFSTVLLLSSLFLGLAPERGGTESGRETQEPKSIHTWFDSDKVEIYNYDVDVRIADFPDTPDKSWLYYFSLQVVFTDHEEWGHGGLQWSNAAEFRDHGNLGVNWGGGSDWAGYGGNGVTNTPYKWETGKWYRFRVWRLEKDNEGYWKWLFAVLNYETNEERQLGTIITKSAWIHNAVVFTETGYGVSCDTDAVKVLWRNPVFRCTTPGEFTPNKITATYNGTCTGAYNTNQVKAEEGGVRQWYHVTNTPRCTADGTLLWQ